MIDFYKNWMEFFFFVLMVIGVVISLLAPNAMINYLIAFFSGMFAGRIVYQRKGKVKFPYLLILLGFLLGYLVGAYYGSRLITTAMFVAGAITSYKLYDKKILKDALF